MLYHEFSSLTRKGFHWLALYMQSISTNWPDPPISFLLSHEADSLDDGLLQIKRIPRSEGGWVIIGKRNKGSGGMVERCIDLRWMQMNMRHLRTSGMREGEVLFIYFVLSCELNYSNDDMLITDMQVGWSILTSHCRNVPQLVMWSPVTTHGTHAL